MRSLIIAAALLAATPAFAADLPAAEEVLPIAVPSFTWTGFYVGAQGGYGWGEAKVKDGIALNTKSSLDDVFVGGKIAALYQFDQFVVGGEAELNYSWLDDKKDLGGFGAPNVISADIKWFGSVAGKVGVSFDRALIYATGGLAVAKIETGQSIALFGASFSKKETYYGWTVGGGLDYAVTDNIIVGAQYRYYDFGKEKISGPGIFTDRKNDVTLHTVSANISYKF